jgi:hypothetical protein
MRNLAAEVGAQVTAKAIQAKLVVPPYSVLAQVVVEDDALQSLEVLVVHGVHTRKAAAEQVEAETAVTGLMAQTIYSDVVTAAGVPLEGVGQ